MTTTKTDFTRTDLEAMATLDRPRVRCKIDCDFVDQDGQVTAGVKEMTGRICIDGNNPWIELWASTGHHAEQFSWGLVLEVLNDPFAAPIWFSKRFTYEV